MRKALRAIAPVLIVCGGIAFCIGVYYLVDVVWNGLIVDWIETEYMITTSNYWEDIGTVVTIREPAWWKLKPLLLGCFTAMVCGGLIITLIAAHFYGKSVKQRTITGISRLLREERAASEFPREYAEIAARMAEIRSAMLQGEQALRKEAARKNDLVTYLAHDLKTPLTSVIGYLSLLDEAPDMPPEQKGKYTRIALDKACRLEGLVNEFFEITRYNLQQIKLEKEQIDLYYLLVQLMDEFYPILSGKGNTAVLKAEESLTVWGDPAKLARVFNNILKNAAAYSFPGSEICISAAEESGSVSVSFSNHGPEIPPEKLSLIFDRFYRMDDARSSNAGGAGLGLAIAREIVTLHGGAITAESRSDTTTFTVTLPSRESLH